MNVLAVDVGGTSTRAAVVTPDGECLGFGTAGSGNPTSFDTVTAVAAIVAATRAALAQAAATPADIDNGVLGIAGAGGEKGRQLRNELISAGLPGRLSLEADLLVAFHSGSLAPDGYVLVAGTGAAAVRVRDHHVEATTDGLGWLLGDAGSGFWIGRRAVRAAASALDGRGPPTVLVDLVLAHLGIAPGGQRRPTGRTETLDHLVRVVYGLRPVELARLAPLVFEAEAAGDTIAGAIASGAADALAATLDAVVVADLGGPLVLSGSIVSHQPSVARRVVRSFRPTLDESPVITVSDGVAGAAVLALRKGGVDVDDAIFARLRASLVALR